MPAAVLSDLDIVGLFDCGLDGSGSCIIFVVDLPDLFDCGLDAFGSCIRYIVDLLGLFDCVLASNELNKQWDTCTPRVKN